MCETLCSRLAFVGVRRAETEASKVGDGGTHGGAQQRGVRAAVRTPTGCAAPRKGAAQPAPGPGAMDDFMLYKTLGM